MLEINKVLTIEMDTQDIKFKALGFVQVGRVLKEVIRSSMVQGGTMERRCVSMNLGYITKNILRIFFHFVIIPLMLPALLIFLTYMLTCYSFAHLLICLAEHITTLSSFLLLSKIQYLKNLYVKQSKESFSISLFLASEDLPAHLRCYYQDLSTTSMSSFSRMPNSSSTFRMAFYP